LNRKSRPRNSVCSFCYAAVFSLKGWNNVAQGNALGEASNTRPSPERAAQGAAMSQSLVRNLVHLVYSTKARQPWISKEHQDDLFAYQAGIFKAWESPAIIIGGVEDHVHALFSLSKNHPLAKIVEEVKKGSSKWMKANGPKITDFQWQAGYGAFSVSPSNMGCRATIH
jgi:putative transposase